MDPTSSSLARGADDDGGARDDERRGASEWHARMLDDAQELEVDEQDDRLLLVVVVVREEDESLLECGAVDEREPVADLAIGDRAQVGHLSHASSRARTWTRTRARLVALLVARRRRGQVPKSETGALVRDQEDLTCRTEGDPARKDDALLLLVSCLRCDAAAVARA